MPGKCILIGLGPDDLLFPEHLRGAPAKKILDSAIQACVDAGFETEGFWVEANDTGLQQVVDKLGKETFDAICIGWGVRGTAKLTPWFEQAVEAVHRSAPNSKLCFNASIDSTAEAFKRALS